MLRSRREFITSTAVLYASMLLVQYALLGFPKPPTGAVSSPPVSHAPRPPRQESRHEQFHDQHLYAPLALDHTVPPGDPPSQRAGVGAANGIDEAGNCGTLVPFGQVTIRHPSRGDNNASEFDVGPPVLMVAYDDDRVFAVPLDGMTFDADSLIYVFLKGAGLADAKVLFKLNNDTAKLSQTGVPYDFMGLAAESQYGASPAVPLRTVRLGVPRCHNLVATVVLANGRSTTVHSKFRVTIRPVRIWLVATIGVQDLDLFEHFLVHYQRVGIHPNHFAITIHSPTADDPRIVQATQLLLRRHVFLQSGERGIVTRNLWIGKFNTFDKFEIQESLVRRLALQQDWVIHPDVDEHQRYPHGDINAFVRQLDERDLTAVFGLMKDRVTVDGSLAEVQRGTSLESQFPLVCDVTKAIVDGAVTKVVLHRGFLMAEEGGYHTLFQWKSSYGRNHDRVHLPLFKLAVSHFKWTSAVGPKLAERERVFKAQGIRWWVQSARLRAFVQESGNRLDIHSDKLSCRTARDDSERYDEKTDLSIQTFIPMAISMPEQFTVILMAYSPKRNANQLRLLTHFSKIPTVHEIVFVWNSQTDNPPDIEQIGRTLRPIRVVRPPVNSLNNRWNHSLYPKTDGVLMLDDDIFLPIQTVRSLHARWLYDSTRLIGLVGRNFADSGYIYPKTCCDRYEHHAAECDKPKGLRGRNVNCSSARSAPNDGNGATGGEGSDEWGSMDVFCDTFRFVLPKGMFFHRKYMRLYTSWKRKKMRQYVDDQDAHCDDIAFNLVVQSATGKAGVILEDDFEELPESSAGLYNASSEESKAVRLEDRTQCVRWLGKYFSMSAMSSFRIESGGFDLRAQKPRGSPINFANRRYSKLWGMMGKCIAANGQRPR